MKDSIVGPRPDRRPKPPKEFRYVRTGWPEQAAFVKALCKLSKHMAEEGAAALLEAFTP